MRTRRRTGRIRRAYHRRRRARTKTLCGPQKRVGTPRVAKQSFLRQAWSPWAWQRPSRGVRVRAAKVSGFLLRSMGVDLIPESLLPMNAADSVRDRGPAVCSLGGVRHFGATARAGRKSLTGNGFQLAAEHRGGGGELSLARPSDSSFRKNLPSFGPSDSSLALADPSFPQADPTVGQRHSSSGEAKFLLSPSDHSVLRGVPNFAAGEASSLPNLPPSSPSASGLPPFAFSGCAELPPSWAGEAALATGAGGFQAARPAFSPGAASSSTLVEANSHATQTPWPNR
jgi:hypothetical protein